MEGYLWKRGRKVPSMKRHYAVLKGTMLSFYLTQDEAQRSGAIPKRVLELVDLRVMTGSSSTDTHIVLKYLDVDGGGTLNCRADSSETQQLWLEALQDALKEPERIAQEEIAEVQEELLQDAQRHSRAVQQATEAVEAAGRQQREQANAETALQQDRDIAVELQTQLETARLLHGEAMQKLQTLQIALEEARQRVHASSLGTEDASSFDHVMEAVERLAAKVEVAASAEATHGRMMELLELQMDANSKEQQELTHRVHTCAEESKMLRQVAAKSLEDAQRVKQRAKRLASWGDERRTGTGGARPSQLDPLVEGYLLCQHPMRTSMHRRYYVLSGNTLCWYADQDAFITKMDAPSGVLHVAEVAEWDGKVKPTSPIRRLVVPFSSSSRANSTNLCPYPFAVLTVEGKTLRCSAPLKKSQEDWIAALHVGLTMPPLSPHRARAAKSRRDSFDLLASSPLSPKRQSNEQAEPSFETASSLTSVITAAASETEELTAEVVVDGYLVGKSSLEETMKKKYCVLRALTLYVFATHHEAATEAGVTQGRATIRSATFHICGVSTWDGQATLMHYDHGFLLQTTEHQSLYCSAPSLHEKNRWVNGVQHALLQYQHGTKRGSKLFDQSTRTDEDEQVEQTHRRPSYSSARREFLTILQQYYGEYHPGKLGDVPMLLSRYQGREQALVEHLDRLYGTCMGKDDQVLVLLAVLATSTSTPSPHRAPSVSNPPASPAIRSSGDLTDWLTWNKETSPSWCVLSGDRLERYESDDHSKTGTPSAVFVATGVHDYPTPSPTMNRSTTTDQELQFFLSGGYETDGQSLSSATELLVLEATSTVAKLQWMTKLRSALTPASESSPSSVTFPIQATTFHDQLVEFYQRQNPKRVGDVDALLSSFAGREQQLLLSLDATYGTTVSSDDTFTAFLPPLSASVSNTPVYREGYLAVKHPRLGASYRKCFCVLQGTIWQCFDSSVVAHSGHAALLSDVVVSLQPVTAKLAETFAFRLETHTNGVILLRSDAAEIVYDWIQALRSAMSVVDHNEDIKDQNDAGRSFQQLRARIFAFFDENLPSKVSDVDALLESFQGRERALLEQLDTVYKSHFATDPVCMSLCADLEADKTATKRTILSCETRTDEAILMEGYLMKRGHKIPSMRKRYCVLIGDELSYYVTHDDSKNPGGGAMTKPLGNFRVKMVSDWHGKTTTKWYENAMELETTEGKTFFCAASTAKEKQQWIDALRRGLALARSAQRRAEFDTIHVETELERQIRAQFREKLADFYRVRNPAKLPDLDLLLSCYTQREAALLEAIDEAYGTNLTQDENLLALVPPLPEQATALATLQLDGFLKKTSGDNSKSLWKRAQTVYVAVNGLKMALFATREGFKSGGGTELSDGMTVLAVKDDDATRFAVETSSHEWLRFEARDVMEKRLWMQLLRAALDAELAQKLLIDEENVDLRRSLNTTGFLLLRLDFECPQDEHLKLREVATAMEEHAVALENGNEFVITQTTSPFRVGEQQTRFRVLSTRAWTPSLRSWPVTTRTRTPRFPFQLVTQEQFVLSCSAATDTERANWIHQVRLGAEQAAALEILEDQLLETKAPLSPGRRSLVEKRERGLDNDRKVIEPVVHTEDEEPPMSGYLSFRLTQSPVSSSEARDASQVFIPHEGFIVLSTRAQVFVYEDESAYYRRDSPVCEAQAVELLSDGVTSTAVSMHSSNTRSNLRHFFPEANDAMSSSLAFAVVLQSVRTDTSTSAEALSDKKDEKIAILEVFPTFPSQREEWIEAFVNRIDLARGEALLADEKLLLKLEQDEPESVEAQEVMAADNSVNDDENASVLEDKSLVVDVSNVAEDEVRDKLPAETTSFVFRTAAMEGILTPWQTSNSPIRIPGSSKMKPMASVYVVLVGCRLRCYPSRQVAAAAAMNSSATRNLLTLSQDEAPSLDLEVTACSSWEAPTQSWLTLRDDENFGLKMEGQGSRHSTCFTAPTSQAKHQWLQVIQHALNFVVAERSLSISERQFTQQVAQHLASIAAHDRVNDNVSRQGFLRVRHHNLGSIWHDHFVRLEGCTLSIYAENDVNEDNTRVAMEIHELVGVEKWHPVFTSLGRSGSGLKGTGFRVETSSGVYLEFIAKTAEDASDWQIAITSATTHEIFEKKTMSRDATLPFITGARMEGYLKLQDPLKSSGKRKIAIKLWTCRYCVVLGSHWLVYATQTQAISSGQAPSPVAVYELEGIAVDGEVTNDFSIRVVPGKNVKCRARSSLEMKRWVNAVEDELQDEAKTTEDLERSVKQREEKLAAREAVKSKIHQVQTDARRLSTLLGEAIETACGDSDTDDSETLGDDSLPGQRSVPDYLDGSPESSPMRRNGGETAFPFNTLEFTKESKRTTEKRSSGSFMNVFTCFFRCLSMNATGSTGRNGIALLGIPGYSSSAAACKPLYTCDYYEADGYQGLTS